METSSEAFAIAAQAREAGHDVRIVPATLVRSLGVGARGVKTDKRDARVLSEVSCRVDLPTVHVPSMRSRDLKAIANAREAMVGARTGIINSVRGYLRQHLIRFKAGTSGTFPARVRAHLLAHPEGLPDHVESMLAVIETLTAHIDRQSKELERMAESDELCGRLMSVPGIGPITALRFIAVVDDRNRFTSAHQLESYLGLTPGERSSSERVCRTGITKAGSRRLRSTLVQAAWAARRSRSEHAMLAWADAVEQRRGRFVATVALARKLVGILFALWRDGTTYAASRGATASRRPEGGARPPSRVKSTGRARPASRVKGKLERAPAAPLTRAAGRAERQVRDAGTEPASPKD
jgi:transposase